MLPAMAPMVTTLGLCRPKKKFESALLISRITPPTRRMRAYELSIATNVGSCPIDSKSIGMNSANGSNTTSQ